MLANSAKQVTHIRSTLLMSSQTTLREHGLFERYASLLPADVRQEILQLGAPSWLPLRLGMAHYQACQLLALDEDQVVEIAKAVAMHREGSFLGIALNLAARRRRRHAVRRFFGLEHAAQLEAPTSPHARLETREAEALVQRALERLAPKKRDVFVLYELEGFSGEEIAEAVGAPLKTVWTRLYHARREIEAELKKRLETAP